VVREASRLGVKALTLFAFSTENWSRPEDELNVLWKLLRKYFVREGEELHKNNVRMRVLGEVERLAPEIRELVETTVARLSGNTGLQLNFAVSYGSRRELVRAAQNFASDCMRGKMRPEEMSESVMDRYLWTAPLGELSDVDLVIRTSGEARVSNFLLWQAAYAEFVFLDKCWPEFGPKDFGAALDAYGRRERRFGGVNK